MQFEHLGASPRIHPDAVIAPTAVISGDVAIGADCQVLHGAVITAEGGAITLGENVIVMENALIRATSTNPVHIGDHVLVGPMASVSGATIGDEVFLATGTRVFNGARIGERSEVRINAVVHLRTVASGRDRGADRLGRRRAIRCRSCRRIGTRRSGRRSANSTSRATSSASTARRPTSWCS